MGNKFKFLESGQIKKTPCSASFEMCCVTFVILCIVMKQNFVSFVVFLLFKYPHLLGYVLESLKYLPRSTKLILAAI